MSRGIIKTVTARDTVSIYDILLKLKTVTPCGITVFEPNNLSDLETLTRLDTVFRGLGKILFFDSYRRVAFFFLEHKASSLKILQFFLKLGRRTLYRILDDLQSWGVVEVAYNVKSGLRGPYSKIYITPDATKGDILKAVRLHKKLIKPKYRYACKVKFEVVYPILQENRGFITGNYLKLLIEEYRKAHPAPYHPDDLYMIICRDLIEEGFKVV